MKNSKANIKLLLTRGFYIGRIVWQGTTYAGKHEPIIGKDLFYRVQEILKNRSTDTGEKRRLEFLLRGVAYCGTCGRRLGLSICSLTDEHTAFFQRRDAWRQGDLYLINIPTILAFKEIRRQDYLPTAAQQHRFERLIGLMKTPCGRLRRRKQKPRVTDWEGGFDEPTKYRRLQYAGTSGLL